VKSFGRSPARMIGQMISAFGADDVAGNRPKFRKLRFQMIADSRRHRLATPTAF
jgi:hypothetical protein